MSELLHPIAIQLETLNFCNAKCVMCPASTTSRARGTMSDATFARIVEQILQLPTKPTVTMHGTGEPLLYKKLGERIRTLAQHGIPVYLQTNGALLTRTRAFDVIDAGVTSIEFSIESLTKEVFERIRVGLDLDEVITNVLSCIEIRNKLNPAVNVGLVCIVNEETEAGQAAYERFFDEHFAPGDQLTIVPRHNFARSYASVAKPSDAACGFVINSLSIQYDGIVNLCCVDSERVHALGDVHKNTIVEIFNGEAFDRIRRAHLEGRRREIGLCTDCNVPESIARYTRRTIASAQPVEPNEQLGASTAQPESATPTAVPVDVYPAASGAQSKWTDRLKAAARTIVRPAVERLRHQA
jgi:organic radical activating enzyme